MFHMQVGDLKTPTLEADMSVSCHGKTRDEIEERGSEGREGREGVV